MIKIDGVSKTYKNGQGEIRALNNVSLEVDQGDIYGVVGYSGAGKSTLLRLVNALEKPDEGSVIVDGRDVFSLDKQDLNELRHEIGMIFQHFNLLNSQTVYQNIALPLILKGEEDEKIKKRVKELLTFVDLEGREETYVGNLSGGQKQRVGIARALAGNPKILLCDEPTSALDPRTTSSILDLLIRVNQELGITILIITHEMAVIKKICNKVAVMEEGRIIERGLVSQVFANPKEETTKIFVSTVINSEVPPSLLKEVEPQDAVIKLVFFGQTTEDAVIDQISKRFDLVANIMAASVNELGHDILGIFTIRLSGDKKEIEEAIKYAESQNLEITIEKEAE